MYRRLIDSRSGACLPRGKGGGVGATISVSAVADVSLYLMVGALQLEDFRHVVLLSLSLTRFVRGDEAHLVDVLLYNFFIMSKSPR